VGRELGEGVSVGVWGFWGVGRKEPRGGRGSGLCEGFESGVDMSDAPSYTSVFVFFCFVF